MTFQWNGRPRAGARQGTFQDASLGGRKPFTHSNCAALAQSVGRLPPPLATAQDARSVALANRAASIAQGLALADAKRALKATDPSERDELRANASLLSAWAKRLTMGAPHAR